MLDVDPETSVSDETADPTISGASLQGRKEFAMDWGTQILDMSVSSDIVRSKDMKPSIIISEEEASIMNI